MTEELGPLELEGGWKRLCAALLLNAAQTIKGFRAKQADNKGWVRIRFTSQEKEEARRWINGAPAVVGFQECCEALGADEEYIRQALGV